MDCCGWMLRSRKSQGMGMEKTVVEYRDQQDQISRDGYEKNLGQWTPVRKPQRSIMRTYNNRID